MPFHNKFSPCVFQGVAEVLPKMQKVFPYFTEEEGRYLREVATILHAALAWHDLISGFRTESPAMPPDAQEAYDLLIEDEAKQQGDRVLRWHSALQVINGTLLGQSQAPNVVARAIILCMEIAEMLRSWAVDQRHADGCM